MGKVRLLSETVASQVAAGEVVERPASLLKELLENSLDAGARRIEVEIARGGSGLIAVRDDGAGMERDDALLALERHATSKIETGEDLARITSFGFRGEALPSIASVTRFRLLTRTRAPEDLGTEIFIEGGKLLTVREGGAPPGTTIEARALFFNLPARKKFLRSEITENGHLLHQFHCVALAHPEVAFVLQKDGRLVHHLGATGDLRVRVRDLLGVAWEETLTLPEAIECGGIRVSGLVSKPGCYRLDRSGQFFFLNRRPVQDAAIARGLRAAWGPMSAGHHPSAILFLEMDPGRFDCNVHPAKREVRFQRPDDISSAVEAFWRQALTTTSSGWREAPAPEPSSPSTETEPTSSLPPVVAIEKLRPVPRTPDLPWEKSTAPATPAPHSEESSPVDPAEPSAATEATSGISSAPPEGSFPEKEYEPSPGPPPSANYPESPERQVPDFQFRGALGQDYLLWESEEGLVLMEVRHALERIFYEEMVRTRSNASEGKSGVTFLPSQQLLPPEVLTLAPQDAAWLRENSTLLQEFGFVVEPFGTDTLKIEAVPAGLEQWTAEELVLRLADAARTGSRAGARRFLQDALCLTLASLQATRRGIPSEEAPSLLRRLFACEMPYVSPSGRPVLLQMGWRELERKFCPEKSTWG